MVATEVEVTSSLTCGDGDVDHGGRTSTLRSAAVIGCDYASLRTDSQEKMVEEDLKASADQNDDCAADDQADGEGKSKMALVSTTDVRRNWSSASIVSAYKMIRNGSVSSTRRRAADGASALNEEKVPLGLSRDGYHQDNNGGSAVQVVCDQLAPPDGGWGWMVLLGTVIVNTLIPGLIKSFGVFFVEFIAVFQTTPSSIAWIPALNFALYNLLGPVASAISMKYSCRFATILGGLSATLGLALSYFATSIEFMYFSYGILGGIGAGMSYTPGILIVGQYFNKRRGLANGICASGSALGSIIIPPFLNYLLTEYGYRGAILILCALLMNVCVGAALYQPVEWHLKRIPRVMTASSSVDCTNGSIGNACKPIVHSATTDNTSPITSRNRPITALTRRNPSNPRFLPGLSAAAEEADVDGDELGTDTNCGVGGSSAPTVTFMVGAGPSPVQYVGLGMGSTSSSLAPVTLNLHRSPSVISTISSSSFAYLSTIYHGSTPAAYQLNQIACGGHRDSLPTSTFGSQIVGRCSSCGPNSANKCTCAASVLPPSADVDADNRKMSAWKMICDVALLKNTVFLLITYTVVASGIGYTNLLIIMPAYATSLGMEKSESSGLLSVIAGADLIGRIGGAWMSDLMSFPCKYLYMAGFVVSGVALMFMPHTSTTFAGLATSCAVFGLASGIYIGLMAVLLVNHLGAEKLGSSFGLSLAINGVVMLSGPPVVAAILENIGSYEPVIFILGVIILSGGLIFVLEPMASGYETKRQAAALITSV